MRISVVIPAYNRADFLERALRSVEAQTFSPEEVLVVDDGSPQGTYTDLQFKFPSVRWLVQKNRGVSAARNLGIRNSSNPWIALLDSDDEWAPLKLKLQVDRLHENPQAKALHTQEKWIRNGLPLKHPKYLDKSSFEIFQRSLRRCIISPSSILLHRTVFDQVGWFDESLPACEDFDFWLRLLLRFNIDFLDEDLVIKHGGHSDQLSKSVWGLDRFRIRSLEKLLSNPALPADRLPMVLEVLIEKTLILEQGARKRLKKREARKYERRKSAYVSLLEMTMAGENS